MKCLEHSLELKPNQSNHLECPSCQSIWVTMQELDVFPPPHQGLLAFETRHDSLPFKKTRLCIECSSVMRPLRVATSENWVLKCSDCERFWLDKIAQKQLKNFAQQKSREANFNKLSEAEKKEFRETLAVAAKETAPDVPLTGHQLFFSSIGIPVLTNTSHQRFPWVTILLLVLMAFLYFVGGVKLSFLLAYRPQVGGITWVTANFVHSDVWHFLGNAFFLISFGNAVEQVLKRRVLLASFFILGPLTILAEHVLSSENSASLGASGSISVLVAATGVLHSQSSVVFWILRRPFQLPVLVFVGIDILYNLIMAASGAPGVAWYGHLAGLLLGLLLGHLAKRPQTAAMLQYAP